MLSLRVSSSTLLWIRYLIGCCLDLPCLYQVQLACAASTNNCSVNCTSDGVDNTMGFSCEDNRVGISRPTEHYCR